MISSLGSSILRLALYTVALESS